MQDSTMEFFMHVHQWQTAESFPTADHGSGEKSIVERKCYTSGVPTLGDRLCVLTAHIEKRPEVKKIEEDTGQK
jgi:hypothetical protein